MDQFLKISGVIGIWFIGLSVYKMAGHVRNIVFVLRDIRDGLEKAEEEERHGD